MVAWSSFYADGNTCILSMVMFTGVYAISKILSNFALKMGVLLYQTIYGHPRGSDGKNLPAMWETRL